VKILGADPGKSGALALWDDGVITAVHDMPIAGNAVDADELYRIVSTMGAEFAIVEQTGARPGQGTASMYSFGLATGTLKAIIAACRIPSASVAPTKWKKYFGLGPGKEQARAKAIALWPGTGFFSRRKDHNRAEAALLAEYAAKVLRGRQP
jgi:hypothetical protein